MKTYQFKIQIKGIQKPPVWRRLLISSAITFDIFHQVIQAAFGWADCHMYQFSEYGWSSDIVYKIPDEEYDDEDEVEDSRLVKLSNVFTKPKQKFTYIYDFGDDWSHQIILEEIIDKKIIKPVCIAGKGACPPEDCGGIPGYENLIDILNDPNHPEYKEMINWLGIEKGKIWDVNHYNSDIVNKRLTKI